MMDRVTVRISDVPEEVPGFDFDPEDSIDAASDYAQAYY